MRNGDERTWGDHFSENRDMYASGIGTGLNALLTGIQNYQQNNLQREQMGLQRAHQERDANGQRLRQQLQSYEYLLRAAELQQWKNWREAAALLRRAINAFKTSIGDREYTGSENHILCEIYYETMNAYLQSHQIDEAARLVEEFNAQDIPNTNSKWIFLKARVKLLQDHGDEAFAIIREMLESEPPPQLQHIGQTYLSFQAYQADEVIRLVGEWETENTDLLSRIFQKDHNFSREDRNTALNASDYFLLRACAHFQNGSFLRAAEYFKRVVDFLEHFYSNAKATKRHEIRLLLLFSSIALCYLTRKDGDLFSEKLHEVAALFNLYREHHSDLHSNLSYVNPNANQHRSLISVTVFHRISEMMTHYRQFRPEDAEVLNEQETSEILKGIIQPPSCKPDTAQGKANSKLKKINSKLKQIEKRLSGIEKTAGEQALNRDLDLPASADEKGKEEQNLGMEPVGQNESYNISRTAFRLLEACFQIDPYEPASLILLSAFQNIADCNSLAHLAMAHLAFCYIHAYRVRRNLQRAMELATDSLCPRGRAELGYIHWKTPPERQDLDAARRCLKAEEPGDFIYQDPVHRIECDGKVRQQTYLAVFNYLHPENAEAGAVQEQVGDAPPAQAAQNPGQNEHVAAPAQAAEGEAPAEVQAVNNQEQAAQAVPLLPVEQQVPAEAQMMDNQEQAAQAAPVLPGEQGAAAEAQVMNNREQPDQAAPEQALQQQRPVQAQEQQAGAAEQPRNQNPPNPVFLPALNELRRLARRGVVFAQAWVAKLLVLDSDHVPTPNEVSEARQWITSACSSPQSVNGPDYFLATLIKSRMHLGFGFPTNYAEVYRALSHTQCMGSTESGLEVAQLQSYGFVNVRGEAQRHMLDFETERERRSAAILWSKAHALNYIDRRVLRASGLDDFVRENYHGAWTRQHQFNLIFELMEHLEAREPHFVHGQEYNNLLYYFVLCLIFVRGPQNEAEQRNQRARQLLHNILGIPDGAGPIRPLANHPATRRALARFGLLPPPHEHPRQNELQALNMAAPTLLRPSVCARDNGTHGTVLLLFKEPKTNEICFNVGKYFENEASLHWEDFQVSPFEGNNFSHPRIAIRNNRVLAVAQNGAHLHFKLANCNNDQVIWTNYNENPLHSGSQASIAFLDANRVIEVHCHENIATGNLFYRIGTIADDTIRWGRSVTQLNDHGIRNPTVAAKENTLVIAFESGNRIGIMIGVVQHQGVAFTGPYYLGQNQGQGLHQHKTPALIIRDDSNFILLTAASGPRNDGLYSRNLHLNPERQLIQQNPRNYDVGYWPTAAAVGEHILSFHDFDNGFRQGRLCRHDFLLNEFVVEPQPANRGPGHRR